MTKRIICALVICIVMFSIFGMPVSAYTFPFKDVKSTSWQYAPVKKVYDLGIMNGVSSVRFEPNKKLTRAEAAMILYNIEGNAASYSKYSFKDVKKGYWYADAVEWMYRKGITKGVTKTRFGASEYITRQDFITFIYRMYKDEWLRSDDGKEIYIRENMIYSFRDYGSIAEYALQPMKFFSGVCMIVNNNTPKYHINIAPVIVGNNGRIEPRGLCTRAEAAVIIGNAYQIDKYI